MWDVMLGAVEETTTGRESGCYRGGAWAQQAMMMTTGGVVKSSIHIRCRRRRRRRRVACQMRPHGWERDPSRARPWVHDSSKLGGSISIADSILLQFSMEWWVEVRTTGAWWWNWTTPNCRRKHRRKEHKRLRATLGSSGAGGNGALSISGCFFFFQISKFLLRGTGASFKHKCCEHRVAGPSSTTPCQVQLPLQRIHSDPSSHVVIIRGIQG